MRQICLAMLLAALTAVAPAWSAKGAEVLEGGRSLPQDLFSGDGGVSAFYRYAEPVPAPGRMLREEPLPSSQTLKNAASGSRILYSSMDGVDGRTPVIVSGDIFKPKGQAPQGGWPLIAWAHGTEGQADVCAPSWRGRSQRDVDYLNAWLAQGYAVVATDYQGLGTPGTHTRHVARAEGYAVLDAIRAALAAHADLAKAVVIVGQSQGAHATVAALSYKATYAPDIPLRASVLTGVRNMPVGTADDLARSVHAIEGGPGSADLRHDFTAMRIARQIDSRFDPTQYLTPLGVTLLQLTSATCWAEQRVMFRRFPIPRDEVVSRSPQDAYATQAALFGVPTLALDRPLFIGTGASDGTVPPASQHAFAKAACAAGVSVEHHYYPGKNHNTALNASLADSIGFVRAAFDARPLTSHCARLEPPPAKPAR